ncbi:alanine racemase [Salipaludibacillus aurantiacus]|uniref:D-serine deaminase, pyridoxal phosphate-dependent n=1 Tax=Salipaludibacillus aurantiacus TaxID=1601833 RepID=A0A1H9SHX7_9BACI|nr:alanine racemase [Salipaludibacillus aurantiacus]SER84498.1 D-serine deaminase, pyridoxal phosphate-dependent [Salipaludibacillus aurantiacus]
MYETIQTPAILLDEAKLNRNIRRMAAVGEKHRVSVRPHFKTHKSSFIANKQIMAGAAGITVAKVSEAELLLEAGIKDILIAHPLVESEKIKKLFPYQKSARLIFTIDSKEQAEIMNRAADGHMIEVWLKVNSGLNRCGTQPGRETLQLAKDVRVMKGLKLTGLFTHAGHSYGAASRKELEKIAEEEAQSVVESALLCEEHGIEIQNRSIGSTPTFEKGASYEGMTEVRPGNAVFFDRMQMSLNVAKKDEAAVTILTQLVSKRDCRLVFDGGSKAFTTEKGAHGKEGVVGFGEALSNKLLTITRLSEEHGIADLTDENMHLFQDLALGDKIQFIPNHACTAVNLYDSYMMLKENGEIEPLPIDGRGKSQ